MKFSIRDLMLLTVIVALAVGWWVDRARVATERDDWRFRTETLAEYFTSLGYKAHWDETGIGLTHPKDESLPQLFSTRPKSGQGMSLLAATAAGRMTGEVRPHEVQPAEPDDWPDAVLRVPGRIFRKS